MSRAALQHAERGAGTHAVQASAPRIGAAHDAYEREADRAAEQVAARDNRRVAWSLSRIPIGTVQRKCECGGMCDECKKKDQTLQRKPSAGVPSSAAGFAPPSVASVLSRPGSALDAGTRGFMESRFGYDFSRVRIHHDDQAAASARDVSAHAYTVGSNIVFNRGRYEPGSQSGRTLLAHELAHVVQQSGLATAGSDLKIGSSNDTFENESERAARSVGQAGPMPSGSFAVRHRLNSPRIQRYEAGEHAQFGETGPIISKAIADRAFSYKVKRGEMPKAIAAKFGVSEEELRAANPSLWRKWPSTTNPGATVEGFNEGDTITIPPVLNAATKDALGKRELTLTVNGVALPYGEGISMGDFFESPEQMMAASPDELKKLSALIEREKAGTPATTKEWQDATGGRYLKLAEKNESHFSPSNAALAPVSGKSSADNKTTWEKNHKAALEASQAGDKEKALATNAFGDHFLTDAFASGHLINKRDVMQTFEQNLPRTATGTAFAAASTAFFDTVATLAFGGDVQKAFSKTQTVACFKIMPPHDETSCSDTFSVHAAIDSTDNFSKLLQGIHMKQPEVFENAVAKGVHDKLNKSGVEVENAKGDKWVLSGDGTLNAKSLEIGRKAVAQSQLNVLDSYKAMGPLDLPTLFQKVWDFVPHPTAGTGETTVKDAVTAGTDPKSASLLGTARKLIEDNYKMIIDELVSRGILTRT